MDRKVPCPTNCNTISTYALSRRRSVHTVAIVLVAETPQQFQVTVAVFHDEGGMLYAVEHTGLDSRIVPFSWS